MTLELPRCRTITQPATLLQAFGSTSKAAFYVVLLHVRITLKAIFQLRPPDSISPGLFLSHEDGIEDWERRWGGHHYLCSVCLLPSLRLVHSLYLCASAFLDLLNNKRDLVLKIIGKGLMEWHGSLFLLLLLFVYFFKVL